MYDNKKYPQLVSEAPHNQQGAVMLFALLILTVMITIGFVLSSLIYREIRLSRNYSDSLQSYYAAESGIEEGLFTLSFYRNKTKLLEDTDSLTDDAITAIEQSAPSTPPRQLTHSGVSYSIDSALTMGSVSSVTVALPQHSVAQIDLYDPDNFLTTVNAQSMHIVWNTSSCAVTSRIEVTFEEFNQSMAGYQLGASNDLVHKDILSCTTIAVGEYACEAKSNWLEQDRNYTIRIRSLDCDIPQMNVKFYSDNNAQGSIVPIPSVASIVSKGRGKLSEYQLTATTKWVPSASGLADFVLFSINAIDKDN